MRAKISQIPLWRKLYPPIGASKMPTFLDHFAVNTPPEDVTFLNLDLEHDTRFFVDPYSIAMTNNTYCVSIHGALKAFMSKLLLVLKNGDEQAALELCSHFQEPKGAGIGWTKSSFNGRGTGEIKATTILNALKDSEAVTSGAIQDLEELVLVVENVAHDTISDITINIGLKHFIEFTQDQCRKLSIPMEKSVQKLSFFDPLQEQWDSDYFELPHAPIGSDLVKEPIILLPKDILRKIPIYKVDYFFTNIATPYFVQQVMENPSILFVRALKTGEYKADLRAMRKHEEFKGGKKRMEKFIKEHPEKLKEYREKVAYYRFNKHRVA